MLIPAVEERVPGLFMNFSLKNFEHAIDGLKPEVHVVNFFIVVLFMEIRTGEVNALIDLADWVVYLNKFQNQFI